MKKLSIAFSLLVLILSSCSSSDKETSVSDLLVKSTVVTTSTEVVNSLYAYDGKKLVGVVSDNGSSVAYTYTGDLITKTENFTDNVLVSSNTYEYDSSNNLTVSTLEIVEPAFIVKRNYFYNLDGTVSVSEVTGATLAALAPSKTENIYFLDNSINKVEITNDGSPTIDVTINLSYDTKNNPFKNVLGFDKLMMVESSSNNNLQYEVLDVVLGTTNYTSSYVYDANDFPIASLRSAGSSASNVTTEFFYE